MTLVINKGFNSALAKKQRFIRTVYDKNFLDKNTGIIKEPQDEKCKFIKSGIAIVILGCSIIFTACDVWVYFIDLTSKFYHIWRLFFNSRAR